MSSDKTPVRNLFESLDDEETKKTVTNLETVNIEIDLSDGSRKSTKGKKMKKVTIVEPDFEDDDEESDPRKTLLFKDARLKLKDLTPGSSKMDRQKLLGEVTQKDSEDDEADEDGDSYQAIPGHDQPNTKKKRKSGNSLETTPSITINKIKIFKPRRTLRQRLRRLRSTLFWFFTFVFFVFLLYNIELLPTFIRTQLGIDPMTGDFVGSGSQRRGQARGECNHVVTTPVWQQNFPMLTIESALRLVDVNNDTHLDLIVPFGTGVDAAYYDTTLCQIYFNQTKRESDGMLLF